MASESLQLVFTIASKPELPGQLLVRVMSGNQLVAELTATASISEAFLIQTLQHYLRDAK